MLDASPDDNTGAIGKQHDRKKARLVHGNGVDLIWSPDGPGWPREGTDWYGAQQVCQHLRKDDLILVSTRHNTRYLTGGYYYPLYMWDDHARRTRYLSFLGIPRGEVGGSFFLGRPGETEVMREAEVWIPHCYEGEKISSLSIAAALVEVLKQRKLTAKRIAVELPSLPADTSLAIHANSSPFGKESLPEAPMSISERSARSDMAFPEGSSPEKS